MITWNPWHGCHKLSAGCQNCYVYRQDSIFDKNSSVVTKNANFDLPLRIKRNGEYKIQSGQTVFTCLTSDFFLDEADKWRTDTWKIIKIRSDLTFLIVTKRVDRFFANLPQDWGTGYDNVRIACTVENQDRANYRIPIFLKLPIKHKCIVAEPLLENINLSPYLTKDIQEVIVGGESGAKARVCDYNWVLNLRQQCMDCNVSFRFHQTGTYLKKDNKVYKIDRKHQHSQAQKANIDFVSIPT